MVVLRWLLGIAAVFALLLVTAFFIVRTLDGPLGPLPGGPLRGGELVAEPVADWSFAADVPEIELQLASQNTSRTTWVIVQDGRAYVPASASIPPGKTWHLAALQDGRATLRIEGRRYPVTLAKVEDPKVLEAVGAVAAEKYPSRPGGEVWLFAVTSRDGG